MSHARPQSLQPARKHAALPSHASTPPALARTRRASARPCPAPERSDGVAGGEKLTGHEPLQRSSHPIEPFARAIRSGHIPSVMGDHFEGRSRIPHGLRVFDSASVHTTPRRFWHNAGLSSPHRRGFRRDRQHAGDSAERRDGRRPRQWAGDAWPPRSRGASAVSRPAARAHDAGTRLSVAEMLEHRCHPGRRDPTPHRPRRASSIRGIPGRPVLHAERVSAAHRQAPGSDPTRVLARERRLNGDAEKATP